MKGREIIELECSSCGRRNYTTTKKRGRKEKLTIKKFCKWCGGYTQHKEVK